MQRPPWATPALLSVTAGAVVLTGCLATQYGSTDYESTPPGVGLMIRSVAAAENSCGEETAPSNTTCVTVEARVWNNRTTGIATNATQWWADGENQAYEVHSLAGPGRLDANRSAAFTLRFEVPSNDAIVRLQLEPAGDDQEIPPYS